MRNSDKSILEMLSMGNGKKYINQMEIYGLHFAVGFDNQLNIAEWQSELNVRSAN